MRTVFVIAYNLLSTTKKLVEDIKRKFVDAYQDVHKCSGKVTCKYCKKKFEV